MKLTINGETKEFAENISVYQMLQHLEISQAGIAIEINGEIVPRSAHEKTLLNENDALEIVKMVAGGRK